MPQHEPNTEPVSVRTISTDPRISVTSIQGEVDMSTSERVTTEIADLLAIRPDTLVVDLSDVTFFGSAGVNVLLDGQAAAGRIGTRLRVVVPDHGFVNRVLTVTGVSAALDLHPDLCSAMYTR